MGEDAKKTLLVSTLPCWKWLSTTTLLMVQSTFVWPGEFVCLKMQLSLSERSQDLIPVRSVWRDWNGYKVTWRTHSGWLNHSLLGAELLLRPWRSSPRLNKGALSPYAC